METEKKKRNRVYKTGIDHHMVRHSKKTVEAARALRAEGWTYAAISREMNLNESTVTYWCKLKNRKYR